MLYGAGFGALADIIYLIAAVAEPTLIGNIFLTILCGPFVAFFGAIVGMFAGMLIGLIDSFLVSIITLNFWHNNILWSKRHLFRASILTLCILLNGVVVLAISTFIPSELMALAMNSIIIATILNILHFERWHFNYLAQYPEILYQSELDTLPIWTDYDHSVYEMPPIPTDLTHYEDGELPTELLRQFPIDNE